MRAKIVHYEQRANSVLSIMVVQYFELDQLSNLSSIAHRCPLLLQLSESPSGTPSFKSSRFSDPGTYGSGTLVWKKRMSH